jgi:hypothetical protein
MFISFCLISVKVNFTHHKGDSPDDGGSKHITLHGEIFQKTIIFKSGINGITFSMFNHMKPCAVFVLIRYKTQL